MVNDFARMKVLKVNGQEFVVSIHRLQQNIAATKKDDWFCGYVILKGRRIHDYSELSCCTYKEGNVYGVDTQHYRNWTQSPELKYRDCLNQLKALIKSYMRWS